MSSIYGDSIFEVSSIVLSKSDISILAEYFTEYPEVIDEQYFSKKDLQDPETLKRLLARFDKEKAIKDKVDNISLIFSLVEGIALGILTKKISIGFISTVGIAIGKCLLFIKTSNILSQNQSNRIKKLREKAVKLRDKAAKENTPEAKEIVNNCNKLINEIDKYFKKIEKAEYKKKYKECRDIYEELVNICHGKYAVYFPHDYETLRIYKYAEVLKISPQMIEDGCKKVDPKNFEEKPWVLWFGENDISKMEDIDKETINILGKYIPEFKDNYPILSFGAIDDTTFFYSRKSNKFYYGGYYECTSVWREDEIPAYIKSHIYDYVKGHINDYDYGIDMDLLKAVDADLGYYRLSEPPEGVTPKKI